MDWREIAEQASRESDPKRLNELIGQLIEALDKKKRTPRHGDQPEMGRAEDAP